MDNGLELIERIEKSVMKIELGLLLCWQNLAEIIILGALSLEAKSVLAPRFLDVCSVEDF